MVNRITGVAALLKICRNLSDGCSSFVNGKVELSTGMHLLLCILAVCRDWLLFC